MCICAGRWCYGLCWSGVRSKALLCVLRLSFPRGAFSKITSKRFPALVICASCKPVLSPIRYARSKVILCQTGWWTPRVEQLDRWRMRQKWRMAQPLRLISPHIGPRAPEARTMSRMGKHGPVQVNYESWDTIRNSCRKWLVRSPLWATRSLMRHWWGWRLIQHHWRQGDKIWHPCSHAVSVGSGTANIWPWTIESPVDVAVLPHQQLNLE